MEALPAFGDFARELLVVGTREWKPGLPLLCENPLKAAANPEGLVLWSSSETHAAMADACFRYDGGPLRARFRFRLSAVEWETTSAVGIQSVSALTPPLQVEHQPRIVARLWGKGSSDAPAVVLDLRYSGHAVEDVHVELPADHWLPDVRATYEAVLEYVPGLDRVTLEIFDGEGARVVGPSTLAIRFPLPPGLYVAGRAVVDRRRPGSGQTATSMTIERIRIEGAGPSVGPAALEPSRGWAVPAVANGRLVLGDAAGAEEAYAEALQQTPEVNRPSRAGRRPRRDGAASGQPRRRRPQRRGAGLPAGAPGRPLILPTVEA